MTISRALLPAVTVTVVRDRKIRTTLRTNQIAGFVTVPSWKKIMWIIIHRTHYKNSDWSRVFNQFTIACELDMINAISAADIAFVMSSSTSAWLLSPLECSPQKQNGRTLRFCFCEWIMWKMYNKTIIEFGFRMISWIIKTSCLCYLLQPSVSADNTDPGFDNRPFYSCELSYLAMNASEARGDLVLIETTLLSSCKCQLISITTTWFTQQKQ